MLTIRNVQLKDLTEVRLELEKVVLRFAIDRMKQEDLIALENSLQRADRLFSSNGLITPENINFHLILARATRNEMFLILMESVMKMVSELLMKLNPFRKQPEQV